MGETAQPRLTDVGYIRALLERHGFAFSKKLGQNFLVNPSVCPRMAEACGAAPQTGVLEIGPGIGVLTRELAQRAGQVVAIELDDRLPPVLAETLAGCDNVTIVQGDCLKLDLHRLLQEHFGSRPVADHHGAAGKPAASDQHHRDGAERGRPAAVRRPRHPRGGRRDAGCAILCTGGAAV